MTKEYIVNCEGWTPDNNTDVYFFIFKIDRKTINARFSFEFVDDYYEIPGDNQLSENREQKLKDNLNYFIWWSWVKCKKYLDEDIYLDRNDIFLTTNDIDWAEKQAKNIDNNIASMIMSEDGYKYHKPTKIGY
jgi:hypothetical protein